jgi:hypothetical protein
MRRFNNKVMLERLKTGVDLVPEIVAKEFRPVDEQLVVPNEMQQRLLKRYQVAYTAEKDGYMWPFTEVLSGQIYISPAARDPSDEELKQRAKDDLIRSRLSRLGKALFLRGIEDRLWDRLSDDYILIGSQVLNLAQAREEAIAEVVDRAFLGEVSRGQALEYIKNRYEQGSRSIEPSEENRGRYGYSRLGTLIATQAGPWKLPVIEVIEKGINMEAIGGFRPGLPFYAEYELQNGRGQSYFPKPPASLTVSGYDQPTEIVFKKFDDALFNFLVLRHRDPGGFCGPSWKGR